MLNLDLHSDLDLHLDLGWIWGGSGVDLGWIWGGSGVDLEAGSDPALIRLFARFWPDSGPTQILIPEGRLVQKKL